MNRALRIALFFLLLTGWTPIQAQPQGAINGIFQVGANSYVYFSQGNLQYIGSAATPYWKTVTGEEGEVVSFKVYDLSTNEELTGIEERVIFTDDALYGSLRQPFMLHLSTHSVSDLHNGVTLL